MRVWDGAAALGREMWGEECVWCKAKRGDKVGGECGEGGDGGEVVGRGESVGEGGVARAGFVGGIGSGGTGGDS